jgi:hypothetical protein
LNLRPIQTQQLAYMGFRAALALHSRTIDGRRTPLQDH